MSKVDFKKMLKELSPEDQMKLQAAMAKVYMSSAFSAVGAGDAENLMEKINEKLDGKTAKEIIAMAGESK